MESPHLSRCRKTFALEPKEDIFGMHDERMRRLVDKLRDGQSLSYTGRQLYYAAGRKHLPSTTEAWSATFTASGVVIAVIAFIARHLLPEDLDGFLGMDRVDASSWR